MDFSLSFSRPLFLVWLLSLYLLPCPSLAVSKDKFYSTLKELCYSEKLFKAVYRPFNSQTHFAWIDMFTNKSWKKKSLLYRSNSSFIFHKESTKSYYLSYSVDQAIQFYWDIARKNNFELKINSPMTVLNNPDSRAYMTILDGCFHERNSMGFSYFHYVTEPLYDLTRSTFFAQESSYSETLMRVMFQIGRGVMYAISNDYYLKELEVGHIKVSNIHGFDSFKLGNPLVYR